MGRCADPYVCMACGRKFAALRAFDAHRVGEFTNIGPDYGRRCIRPPSGRFVRDAHHVWHRRLRKGEPTRAQIFGTVRRSA